MEAPNKYQVINIVGKTPKEVYQIRVSPYKKSLFRKPKLSGVNYDSQKVFIDDNFAKGAISTYLKELLNNKLINSEIGFEVSIIKLQVDNKKVDKDS